MLYFIYKQEWEHFTRTLLTDLKSDKKGNVPKWIEVERASDFVLLKVNNLLRFQYILSALCHYKHE